MIDYIKVVLSVILALIIGIAGYQALFGPEPRAVRAERVLRVALAPAVLGALLGSPTGQEIVEWITAIAG